MPNHLFNALQAGHFDGVYLVKGQDRDIYRQETIFHLIPGGPKYSKGPLPRVMIKGSHIIAEDGSAGVIAGIEEKESRVSNFYKSTDLFIRIKDDLSQDLYVPFGWPKAPEEKPVSGSLDDLRAQFAKPRGGG